MKTFPLVRTLTLIIERSFLIALIDFDILLGSPAYRITNSSTMLNFYDDNNAAIAPFSHSSRSPHDTPATRNINWTPERPFKSKRCKKLTSINSYVVWQRDSPDKFRSVRHHECAPFMNSTLKVNRRPRTINKRTTYWRRRFKRTTLNNLKNHYFSQQGVTSLYFDGTPPLGDFRPTEPTQYGYGLKLERVKRNITKIKWPNKRVVSIEGDAIIGGLMMVHERGAGGTLCGPIMAQGGVQALDVMLYTLNEVNKNRSNPFTIGAHILDDCDTDTYGLEMALDFIKGKSKHRRIGDLNH